MRDDEANFGTALFIKRKTKSMATLLSFMSPSFDTIRVCPPLSGTKCGLDGSQPLTESTLRIGMSSNGDAGTAPLQGRPVADSLRREKTKRVLTVGDGNFSYSLAYAKRFLAPPDPSQRSAATDIELVATSYDSYDELVEKYPESTRICTQLRELGARVLHRIDATNLQVSLENAVNAKETAVAPFDVIVFNHPHCGEENVKRHQSLLSHFYTSALQILNHASNPESEIHLTLAVGQPERWEAVTRGVQAGLALKQQVNDVDSHDEYGLVYERKRHQNGKSFHRVLLHGEKLQQESTLFIFAKRGAVDRESVQPDKEQQKQISRVQGGHASEAAGASTIDSAAPSRKRKVQDAALTLLEFACESCERSFKTVQGLKTHVHMVHELGQVGAARPVLLPCGFCERTFRNEDAQRQHRLAKHGKDQLIQPDWYQKQQEEQQSQSQGQEHVPESAEPASGNGTQELRCSVCRQTFPTQTIFDDHWQNLKPKAMTQRRCDHCGRRFDEDRALRQHQNFCRASDAETK